MRKYYNSALLSLSLLISGCNPLPFLNLSFKKRSTDETDFYSHQGETWLIAEGRHIAAVKKLKPDPQGRYRITVDKELLITNPIALEAALKRANPFSSEPNGSLEGRNVYQPFKFNGGTHLFVIAEGKVFFSGRRIYDVSLLMRLVKEEELDLFSFLHEASQ